MTTKEKEEEGVVPQDSVVKVSKTLLESMAKRMEEQDKKIEMLTHVADKSRLSRWNTEHKDAIEYTAKVSTFDGKIIVAWKTLQNDVYQDTQGRWHEVQEVEIVMDDNSVVKLSYMDFVRRITKVEGNVVSQYTTPEGEAMVRMNVMNKKIDIDQRFIN